MIFVRTVEDFVCDHCGHHVVGNGYTNHCPKCLYSKHVDVTPGDRASSCGGLMAPISVEGATGKGYIVRHKCVKCGYEKVNAVAPEDDMDAVIALAKKRAAV